MAPYESDPQLTFMVNSGYADFAISEDSDLIVYGCEKVNSTLTLFEHLLVSLKVMFKLDFHGRGSWYEKKRLDEFLVKKRLTFDQFRWLSILSGCDYLENLPGVGLGRAEKLVRDCGDGHFDIRAQFKRYAQHLPESYVRGFDKAEFTFKNQIYYDLLEKKLKPRYAEKTDRSYCGRYSSGDPVFIVFFPFVFFRLRLYDDELAGDFFHGRKDFRTGRAM